MLGRIRLRLNHATVIAYLALFVALGGTSVAALRISSKQIVNNSVRSKDLRNNDVRGSDIRSGTVGSSDVRDDSLTGLDVNESTLGAVPLASAAASAASAGNAGSLDGLDSTAFLAKGGKAADADLLDGLDSSELGLVAETTVDDDGCALAPGPSSFCVIGSIVLPRPGRVLLMATAEITVPSFTGGTATSASGGCELRIAGIAVATGEFGEVQTASGAVPVSQSVATPQTFALSGLSPTLAAGSHGYDLVCGEADGNVEINNRSSVTAALVGA